MNLKCSHLKTVHILTDGTERVYYKNHFTDSEVPLKGAILIWLPEFWA